VSLEADTTLLTVLDDAAKKHNMDFNSAVVRKALKNIMYDDLKVCNFNAMVGSTLEIINSRFVPDEGEAITSEEFYSMTCGQVLQKLSKTAQSKIRNKENMIYIIYC
jgi:hypothetical protein